MVNYALLGENIRLLRKAKSLTQAELAQRAGLSVSFLGHIERGTRILSLDTLITLADILDSSPDRLLNYQGTAPVDKDIYAFITAAADALSNLRRT